MIISCPQCDARYEVDAQVLSPNGRQVRCAKCGHQWTERPPAGPAEPEELDYVEEDAGLDDFRATRRAISHQTKRKKREYLDEKPGRGTAIAAWAALAAAIVVIIGGGIVARNQIVSIWGPAARIYEIVGLELEIRELGLELQVTDLRQLRNDDNELMIHVTGEIVNVSAVVKTVPLLEGALLNVRQQPIHSWRFNAAAGQLNPGEATAFKTSVKALDGTTEVFVSFAAEG